MIIYRIVAAAILERLGEREGALAQANTARELLGQNASVPDQMMLADLLLDLGEPADAAEIVHPPCTGSSGQQNWSTVASALLAADGRAAAAGAPRCHASTRKG